MEICVPEIIAFDVFGEQELSGSIHTVIGGNSFSSTVRTHLWTKRNGIEDERLIASW